MYTYREMAKAPVIFIKSNSFILCKTWCYPNTKNKKEILCVHVCVLLLLLNGPWRFLTNFFFVCVKDGKTQTVCVSMCVVLVCECEAVGSPEVWSMWAPSKRSRVCVSDCVCGPVFVCLTKCNASTLELCTTVLSLV